MFYVFIHFNSIYLLNLDYEITGGSSTFRFSRKNSTECSNQ